MTIYFVVFKKFVFLIQPNLKYIGIIKIHVAWYNGKYVTPKKENIHHLYNFIYRYIFNNSILTWNVFTFEYFIYDSNLF